MNSQVSRPGHGLMDQLQPFCGQEGNVLTYGPDCDPAAGRPAEAERISRHAVEKPPADDAAAELQHFRFDRPSPDDLVQQAQQRRGTAFPSSGESWLKEIGRTPAAGYAPHPMAASNSQRRVDGRGDAPGEEPRICSQLMDLVLVKGQGDRLGVGRDDSGTRKCKGVRNIARECHLSCGQVSLGIASSSPWRQCCPRPTS